MAPLRGIWKLSVSVTSRQGAAAAKLLPRRLRLLEDAGVEVPYDDGASGSWRLQDGPSDAMGAQAALLRIEGARGAPPALHLHGLFDGERIAGSITASDTANGPGEEVGEFLCTRLFSFWGTPQPKAAQGLTPKGGEGE